MDWREKLVPFDAETTRMVESLTEKECEIKNGGDYYFFEADYSLHSNPDYIYAIWTSIEGRLGKRLINIEDDPDRKKLIVKVKFSTEKLPRYYQYPKSNPDHRIGNKYHKETIYAVQFHGTIESANSLAAFVGNGEVEIPTEGDAIFSFIDPVSGVTRTAHEGEYVAYKENCPYLIISQTDFEKEWK